MLVNRVTVEFRTADGTIRGVPAQVVDFNEPDNNDWLVVNPFMVLAAPPVFADGAGRGSDGAATTER